jgi:general stress protein 26
MVYTVCMPTIDTTNTAKAFLLSHSTGVLATLSPEGAPRARTMYYAGDDAFNIFFLTVEGTRKVDDLAHTAEAAFVISNEEGPQTLQIEGTVSDITETATLDPVTHNLLETLLARGEHFAPVTRLDMGSVHLYKLSPMWIRWGDFTQGQGSNAVLLEIPS